MSRGTNRFHWNWFYHEISREARCFNGVVLQFIYCGVIVTDVYGNKRAEFVDDNFYNLFTSVLTYMTNNFRRHRVIIHVKRREV